jgi:hypothetical protein
MSEIGQYKADFVLPKYGAIIHALDATVQLKASGASVPGSAYRWCIRMPTHSVQFARAHRAEHGPVQKRARAKRKLSRCI